MLPKVGKTVTKRLKGTGNTGYYFLSFNGYDVIML